MKRLVVFLLTIFVGVAPAAARVSIDITQGNVDPMPIAAPNFVGDTDDATNLGRDITGVFMSDLDPVWDYFKSSINAPISLIKMIWA